MITLPASGSLAVQLARNAGARVVGIALESNRAFLAGLGVDTVTYGPHLHERLSEPAPHIHAWIDAHGSGYVDVAISLGVEPARIDTVIDFDAAARHGTRTDANAQGASTDVLAHLAELAAYGDLVSPVAAAFPLEQVPDAFALLEQGHTRGKIALSTRLTAPIFAPAGSGR